MGNKWRFSWPGSKTASGSRSVAKEYFMLNIRARMLLLLTVVGFALGIAWLIVGHLQSASSYQSLYVLRDQTARNVQLDELMSKLIDAEVGAHGFTLTQNPQFLLPFADRFSSVQQTIQELRLAESQSHASRQALDLLDTDIKARWGHLVELVPYADLGEGDLQAPASASVTADTLRQHMKVLRAESALQVEKTLAQSHARFAEVQERNLALGFGVLILLTLLIVMILREDHLRRRMAMMLGSENERLQREVRTRTAELNDLASYLTKTREIEQERLARELHDELGSLLTAARLDVSWIMRKLPRDAFEPLQPRLERLLDILNQVISFARRVVADLRPPLLSDLGLTEALRSLIDSADGGEQECTIQLELAEDLPPLASEVSLALYRIAQESLTNVWRYAKASKVRVSLRVEDDALILEVADNGIGFDTSLRRPNRYGLVGMAHRTQMLNGDLEVHSAIGRGTTIRVMIPKSHWF